MATQATNPTIIDYSDWMAQNPGKTMWDYLKYVNNLLYPPAPTPTAPVKKTVIPLTPKPPSPYAGLAVRDVNSPLAVHTLKKK